MSANSRQPDLVMVKERSAAEYGWLRRSDLDEPTWDAWEKPDGTLYAAQPGRAPRIFILPPGGVAL